MRHARYMLMALSGLAVGGQLAVAHFNMLLPQTAAVKRGESATLLYQWGHPFEHQIFDAPSPQSLVVFAPDGRRIDLGKALEKVTVVTTEKKQANAFRIRFTPESRGDHVFLLTSAPIWMEEDQEFLQDTVKVVLHVQAQNGWDRVVGQAFEMVPLTRPYGLHPGMVFQSQARAGGKPVANALVEIERYNAVAPKELPPDEHVTRTAKTDPNGIVTCTLTEPGWWCITAQRAGGQRVHQAKTVPVRERATLWVFVEDKDPAVKQETRSTQP